MGLTTQRSFLSPDGGLEHVAVQRIKCNTVLNSIVTTNNTCATKRMRYPG